MSEAFGALAAWGEIGAGARLVPVGTGLIHLTYRVETAGGPHYALQRVNPIFGREVQRDIDRVGAHLERKGIVVPRLVPPSPGELDIEHQGAIWRLMTWIPGVSLHRVDHAERAKEAGRLLGAFHHALRDYNLPFLHRRLGVHDTESHLRALQSALGTHRGHARYEPIQELGEEVLAAAARLPKLPELPERVVHGDPKLDNLVFGPGGEGRALVDLDTLGRMPLPLELGDALRSWCNPAGEDEPEPTVRLDWFEAALVGYAEAAAVTEPERLAIVAATRTIMVELSARFCRDALEENYFGWDPSRYPTRSHHAEVRARGQLHLAHHLEQMSGAAEAAVGRAFAHP